MLPKPREIRDAAIGCWSLVLGRELGLARFNLTMDGFWRSFQWAPILAILDAIDGFYGRGIGGDEVATHASDIAVVLSNGVASLLTFLVFPVVVALLARVMHLGRAYVPYIIVRNWLTVFLSVPVYLLDALATFGLLPDQLRDLAVLILVVVTLSAGTVIARQVLKVSLSLAFGFAFLDFLLALVFGEAAVRVLGGG